MSDVFKALADPTRRKILMMLVEEPSSVNNISKKFNMTRPAVSKHLKILESSNLVGTETDQTDGRQRNCYAQLEALKEVEDFIGELEKHWKSKLNNLGNYLAKSHKNE